MNLSTMAILGCLIIAAVASRGYRNRNVASHTEKQNTETELSEF